MLQNTATFVLSDTIELSIWKTDQWACFAHNTKPNNSLPQASKCAGTERESHSHFASPLLLLHYQKLGHGKAQCYVQTWASGLSRFKQTML